MRGMALLAGAMLCLAAAGLCGCTSYVAPGRGAELTSAGLEKARAEQGDYGIEKMLQRKPLAKFPTAVAVVRVQGQGYRSYTNEGWGSGRYSVVTVRDVEKDEDFERVAKWKGIKGLATVNRLMLPSNVQSDKELREAAARLGAEVLVLYTLDTTFNTEDHAGPLTVVSLGLSPNRVVKVSSTASALILDTRNGYIYGSAEATEKTDQLTNAWQNETAADQSRLRAERRAFGKLVGELEKSWGGVVATYGGGAGE